MHHENQPYLVWAGLVVMPTGKWSGLHGGLLRESCLVYWWACAKWSGLCWTGCWIGTLKKNKGEKKIGWGYQKVSPMNRNFLLPKTKVHFVSCYSGKGGGGVLNKFWYGEAPPLGRPPYPWIYHFLAQSTPSAYRLLKNGALLIHLV